MTNALNVGIPIIGGKGWLGGIAYIEVLIKALSMLPKEERPNIALVVTAATAQDLELHGHILHLVSSIYYVGHTPGDHACSPHNSRSFLNFSELSGVIDFYFPANCTVMNELCSGSWIPDFQHVHLPQYFSQEEFDSRTATFSAIAQQARLVVFSSNDAKNDFHKLFPTSRALTKVLSFHSLPDDEWYRLDPALVQLKYNLPDRFLICCNQFWAHKNHELMFKAFSGIVQRGSKVQLVCTGATTDYRDSSYFQSIQRLIDSLDLRNHVHILGTIPRNDQIQLMRRALAVIQPSLFEGWSTVVEDARVLGKTIVLSDLDVNHEQSPHHAHYFDRFSVESLQKTIESILPDLAPGPDLDREKEARKESIKLARKFARNFIAIAQLATRGVKTAKSTYLVSAIVSTYNSERYFRDCLKNLVTQTLFKREQLEIIIIDSGSQQGEAKIAAEFMNRYPHISYARTERETLYAAWNRAIDLSNGRYIVNTNTDDTLRDDALELLASSLEQHPDADLAYASCYFSRRPNDRFDSPDVYLRAEYPPFNPALGMMYCLLGPHPMWRGSVFDRIGCFDPTYRAAGDYEFQFRFIKNGLKAIHLDDFLSVFCQAGDGSSLSGGAGMEEARMIEESYRLSIPLHRLYDVDGHSPRSVARAWVAQGNLAVTWSCPWEKNPLPQTEYAIHCYKEALSADPSCGEALNNICAVLISNDQGNTSDHYVDQYGAQNPSVANKIREGRGPELIEVSFPPPLGSIVSNVRSGAPLSGKDPNPLEFLTGHNPPALAMDLMYRALRDLERGSKEDCHEKLSALSDVPGDDSFLTAFGLLCIIAGLPQMALRKLTEIRQADDLISLYIGIAQAMAGGESPSDFSLQTVLERNPELKTEMSAEAIIKRLLSLLHKKEYEILGFPEGVGELLNAGAQAVNNGALPLALDYYQTASLLPDPEQLFSRALMDKISYLTAETVPGTVPTYTPLLPAGERHPAPLSTLSRLCTQEEFESLEYEQLCRDLDIPQDHYERKNWEYFFVAHGLKNAGMLTGGTKGLGFGVGKEKLISYFAQHDCSILATDINPDSQELQAWVATNQHSDSVKDLFVPGICDFSQFMRNVQFKYVDMNAIPEELQKEQYDFTWSCCSFEHVGSIEQGKQFILNQMKCLRPGGIALHTTEFNLSSDELTVDSGMTVIFRRRDIEDLARSLREEGHEIVTNYDVGNGELDRYVDIPPYLSAPDKRHLRLLLSQYITTSIGLCIRKKGSKGMQPVTVGIDGRTLTYRETGERGIGQYTVHHVSALAEKRPHWRFVLYLDQAADNDNLRLLTSKKNITTELYKNISINKPDLFHITDPMSIIQEYASPFTLVPATVPTSIVFYDLIPLVLKNEFFDRWSDADRNAYLDRIDQLKASRGVILAISDCTKMDLHNLTGIPQERIVTILAGLNSSLLNAPPSQPLISSTLSQLGIDRPFFLCVGGQESRKRFNIALAAYNNISSSIPAQLVVVGSIDDPWKQLYRNFIQERGIHGVIFTGFISREELECLYATATALLFPSVYEGFGFPVLEAMANSCPVITCGVSSLPEVAGDAALFVEPDSAQSLEAAMLSLLKDNMLRETLIKQGRKQAQKFSWEQVADKSLAAIEALLESENKNKGQSVTDNHPVVVKKVNQKLGFNVISYVSSNLGTGVSARNIIQLLLDQGAPVSILDIDAGLGRGKSDLRYEQYTVTSPDALHHPITLFILPPFHIEELLRDYPSLLSPNKLNVALSMWELAVLPRNLITALEQMDAVVAASDHIRHAFAFNLSNVFAITTKHPLYLPEGIRSDRSRFGLPPVGTLFVTSFEPYSDIERKNPFAVIESFQRAFPTEKNAYLVIKLNNAVVNENRHPVIQQLHQATGNNSRIIIIAETLSYVDTLSLYASCDVFVSLHRAEGLGLGLMEAMLLGKPVVATAWSGNMSFMDHTCSCPVSYRLVPVTSNMSVYSREYLGKEALWADPNLDDAVGWMRRLYQDKELRIRIGERGADSIRTYHEDAISGRFLKEIEALAEKRGILATISPARHRERTVSIIIPLYNKAEYTKRCLEGIFANDNGAIRYELILVDNASSDGTDELLKSFTGDIQVITNRKNLGFAKACNQGARLATGDYLLFLNNDTIPKPGWLEPLLDGMEVDGADICGARLLYPDGKVQHAGVAFNEEGIGYHIFSGFHGNNPAVTRKRFMQCVTAACMMIRRTLFQELAGFDEGYVNGYEDVDLCLRAGTLDKKILYVPESTLIHFEESSEGRKSHEESNARRYLSRWSGRVLCDDNDYYFKEGYSKEELSGGRVRLTRVGAPQPTKPSPAETDRQPGDTPPTSGSSGKLIQQGMQLETEGRYADALELFTAAKQLGEGSAQTHRGDCLANLGRFQESEAAYQDALTVNGQELLAQRGIGVLKLLAQAYPEAAAAFGKALRIDPTDSKALCGLGMARIGEGRAAMGAGYLKKSLESDPENVTALTRLVHCAYQLESYDEAAGYLRSYLMYHPGDKDMLYSQAGLLYKSGKLAEAMEQLERLLALYPDYEGGEEFLRKITDEMELSAADPGNGDRQMTLGRRLKEQGEYARALESFSRAYDLGEFVAAVEMGDCLARLGRLDGATEQYKRALQHDENSIKALIGLGVTSLLTAKQVQAVTWFNKALKIEPADPQALAGLGMAMAQQGKDQEAFDLFAAALEGDPENLTALNELLRIAYAGDRLPEAEPFLKSYLMYHPADHHILYSLAGLLYRTGKLSEAQEALERILTFEPAYEGGKELEELINNTIAAGGNPVESPVADIPTTTPSNRVMIACSHFWPSIGGMETIVEQLAANLVAAGYEVDIMTASFPGRTCDSYFGARIISLDLRAVVDGAPEWLIRIKNEVTSGKYKACILIQAPTGPIIGSMEGAVIPAGTELIIQPIINDHVYATWRDDDEFRNRLGAILRNADSAVAMTRDGIDVEYMRSVGVSPRYIPNAVSICPPYGDFRQEQGIARDEFLILHVANLYRVKNHLALMEELSSLPKPWRLVMIGHPWGDPEAAEQFLRELPNHPDVLYIPGLPKEKISAAMEAADVLLLASLGEGSPVTILEAMAHGKPWIATPTCGAVHDNAGGIISPLPEFRKNLALLYHNPEIRRQLGMLGQAHWGASFSWPVVIKGWIELIETGNLSKSFDMPATVAQKGEELNREMDTLRNAGSAPLLPEVSGTAREHATLGMQLKEAGNHAQALESFSRAFDLGELSVLAEMGSCLARLGRMDEATARYKQALQRDENDIKALIGLGVTNLLDNKLVQAVTWFNKALKVDPADSQALTGLGLARVQQNKQKEAFDLFAAALKGEEENIPALNELLKIAYGSGRLPEAEPFLRSYLAIHPADRHMLYSLAGLLYRTGKLPEARDTLERVLTMEPAYEGGKELEELINGALNG